MPLVTTLGALVLSLNLLGCWCQSAHADERPPRPVRVDAVAQIDQFMRQQWSKQGIEPAQRCSDTEFVRRLMLDLSGRVPTLPELESFLADERPDKRQRLVDGLLTSEDYAQHFTDLFDTLLMGRTTDAIYRQRVEYGWRSYLESVFRENRRWDQVAAEILLARPDDSSKQGAVWFLYERNDKHQAIAESIAPAFFGIHIECAQCHDHMSVDEIKQAHYWGLVAFFNRSSNVKTELGPQVAESAVGGFSEFANLSGDSSPNLLSFLGAVTVDEPRPAADEKPIDSDDLYVAAAMAGEPRIPKFSRRQQFVDQVTRHHPLLARAMVNRLWAILFGRGIVHPYDELDSMHEASHPELLDWLANDFAVHYDIRRTLRSLALSEAYQLSSSRPPELEDPATFAWYLERRLTGEQMARSIQVVARGSFSNDADLVRDFRQQLTDVLPDETVVKVDDALFLSNGRGLEKFLADSVADEYLIGRVSKIDCTTEQCQQLFWAALGRQATAEETDATVAFLDQRSDDPVLAVRHVLWSLITSAEFQFNH
ncbi:MAG: DUF1549 domain-containing protein [Planctomycetales bacterium]|nr:DUF1549 domain-containing protein [Planctomycetales bacterium]